ncbi:MAG: hypothetical protein VW226_00580 [Rhodospirillaceae bacterium]
MRRFTIVGIALLMAGLVGCALFLAATDIPAPSSTVERMISDDRFPR